MRGREGLYCCLSSSLRSPTAASREHVLELASCAPRPDARERARRKETAFSSLPSSRSCRSGCAALDSPRASQLESVSAHSGEQRRASEPKQGASERARSGSCTGPRSLDRLEHASRCPLLGAPLYMLELTTVLIEPLDHPCARAAQSKQAALKMLSLSLAEPNERRAQATSLHSAYQAVYSSLRPPRPRKLMI